MKRDLENILEINEQLLNWLTGGQENKKRDEIINQVNLLLDKREEMIKELAPPYTEEEVELGREIIRMDEEISRQMVDFQSHLKKELTQVSRRKASAISYNNPYKDVGTIDGMFLDQKK